MKHLKAKIKTFKTFLLKLTCTLAYTTMLVILDNHRKSLRTVGVYDLSDLDSESGIESSEE